MNYISYHENMQRGTFDFPFEIYQVDENHPKYNMQMHWHKDFEIIRILSGSLELKMNEKTVVLKEKNCVFIPGGIIHGAVPKNCKYACIVFSSSALYTTPKCRSLIKNYLQSPVWYESNSDIDSILSLFSKKSIGYELQIISKLYAIAYDAINTQPKVGVAPNEKLEKIKSAISMIEENYNKKITLNDLASACRLSPNYFSRYFKEITNQTPFEYIITYRIEAACEMLSDSSSNVTEVCYNCGFNDLSYFIHIFKKHKGMSPKSYISACNH